MHSTLFLTTALCALQAISCASHSPLCKTPSSQEEQGLRTETEGHHRQAASELFTILDLEGRQNRTIDRISQRIFRAYPMDAASQEVALEHLRDVLGFDSLREDIARMYLEKFTQRELEEMVSFYETKTGRKAATEGYLLEERAMALGMERHKERLGELMKKLDAARKESMAKVPAPTGPPAPADVSSPPKGAQCTQLGVCYRELSPGRKGGKQPSPEGRVEVHYSGWTADGKLFDSSVGRGKTATFGVNQVIQGWSDGLLVMTEGSKYRFWIPSELAYGSAPLRPGAPAGQLTFDIELIEVKE